MPSAATSFRLLAPASLLLGLSLGACASLPVENTTAAPLVRVRGHVHYQEAMLLPQGATLRVALHDLGREERVVAYQDTWPSGGGAFSFLLQLDAGLLDPRHAHGLSARITDAQGRLLWVTERIQPVSTSSPGRVEIVVRPAEGNPAPAPRATTKAARRTLSFDCEGLAVTVHVAEDRARLVVPDRTLVLDRVRGGAGLEYGHAGALVRIQGDALFLELAGRVYRSCEPRTP